VSNIIYRVFLLAILVSILIASPLPVKADGGPIVGPYLWASLSEGHQIAVITLADTETAEVDLFISMLDSTGESHEVVFFVPLGSDAAEFNVYEQNSLAFDRYKTENLDEMLHKEAERKRGAVNSLFAATLLTNGIWLLPLWVPVILSGCGSPPPEATFETDSTQVSIYGLDKNTDLEGLIATTGLDPSVRETLTRLRGQKIAVVTLQTQALGIGEGPEEYLEPSEPGIHLHWTTSLMPDESGSTYAYPLGTGAAWSHPIEMTRVYVVAPRGIDFSVQYPRLGDNRSGYSGIRQRITDYYDVPAFAVDEVVGDYWHVWRIIYTQSNAAEDIIVTARPQSTLSRIYASMHAAGNSGVALALGIIMAIIFWLLSWRYLVPRVLRGSSPGEIRRLWKFALIYIGVNALLLIPGAILYMIWSFTGSPFVFVFLLILFAGASTIIFFASRFRRLFEKESQALKAFVLVTLASNGAYLIFALIYAALTGVI